MYPILELAQVSGDRDQLNLCFFMKFLRTQEKKGFLSTTWL
jgi:hypothetical protein